MSTPEITQEYVEELQQEIVNLKRQLDTEEGKRLALEEHCDLLIMQIRLKLRPDDLGFLKEHVYSV